MLKENDQELKLEMLKIILSNPANKIMEMNHKIVAEKLSFFIRAIRKPEPPSKETP
jgi:hypothetical protein